MVGSTRIVPVASIVHPLGNPEVPPELEKRMRREVVLKALDAVRKK